MTSAAPPSSHGVATTGTATIGLDIGGTKTLGVMMDAQGRILARDLRPTLRGGQGVPRTAVESADALLAAAGYARTQVSGLGIGIPGLVDSAAGAVIHAVNVGIDGVPLALAELVTQQLSIPVTVDNDLNVAVLGASHTMGATGGDIAFLSLGTGVAAGIVLDGVLRRGVSGAAGEIGHIPIVPDGPHCACGQRGCIELYASGPGIERQWPSRAGAPAPRELFDAAECGDATALQVRAEIASAIAAAVRIIALTVDVRYVVLGGGVAGVGPRLVEVVGEALRQQARQSAFLASLDLAQRVVLAPVDIPVAAVGAALVGRGKVARWKS